MTGQRHAVRCEQCHRVLRPSDDGTLCGICKMLSRYGDADDEPAYGTP
ncbi:hypothetical protein AB0J47_31320 [Nocardia sp. NPDC049737]